MQWQFISNKCVGLQVIKCNLDRSRTHARTHTTRYMAWCCVGWQEHDLHVGEMSGWAIIRPIYVFPQPTCIVTAQIEWPAYHLFRTSTPCCRVTLPNQTISQVWCIAVASLTYKTSLRLVEVSVSRDFLTEHILMLIISDRRGHNNYFKTQSSAI